MAIRYAIKNGNWSDPTTWNGGLGLPTSTDDVRTNNFTTIADVNTLTITPASGQTTIAFSYQVGKVTVTRNGSPFTDFTATDGISIILNLAANGTDQYVFTNAEWQVLTINNVSGTGITAGGTIRLKDGITLRVTGTGNNILASVVSNTTPVVEFLDPSPAVANIIGNPFLNDVAAGAIATRNSSSGTLNITSTSISSGSHGGGGTSYSIVNNSSGTINIVASTSISVGSPNTTILNSSSGLINITSPIITGGGASTIVNASTGTVNIATGGSISGGTVITNSSAGTVNINCSVTAGTGSGTAIVNNSTGTINISPGNSLTGGSGSITAYALLNNSTGTVNHLGTVIAGSQAPAIGPGSTSQLTLLTGPFIGHPNGTQANIARAWRWNVTNPATYIEIYSSNLLNTTPRRLYTADFVGGNPSVSNVRKNTTFGPVNELTGTMAVPAPQFVKGGVGVDNTVGTAVTTGADIWNVSMGLVSGASGTVGERLKNSATIQSVGAQIKALGT